MLGGSLSFPITVLAEASRNPSSINQSCQLYRINLVLAYVESHVTTFNYLIKLKNHGS